MRTKHNEETRVGLWGKSSISEGNPTITSGASDQIIPQSELLMAHSQKLLVKVWLFEVTRSLMLATNVPSQF